MRRGIAREFRALGKVVAQQALGLSLDHRCPGRKDDLRRALSDLPRRHPDPSNAMDNPRAERGGEQGSSGG
jgi:hypothetical protein